ncbi:hypothetical protein ABMY47_21685 [Pseudoalteromonas sp. BZP1]|uniref:hypothetical protein n=1 Tax=Pseudoalteromonas sp. BZP1 TaxID=3136671 RepID=UPI0032C4556D
MVLQEETIELRRKREKKELVLNHQVNGEAFISSPSPLWKNIVLSNFNRIHRGDITISQLLIIMKDKDISFTQHDNLVKYPVIECLHFIAKVSNIKFDLKEEKNQ